MTLKFFIKSLPRIIEFNVKIKNLFRLCRKFIRIKFLNSINKYSNIRGQNKFKIMLKHILCKNN